ncbi:MAG: hypothetical protein R6V58_10725 [Planctomycetota bacterium]
MHVMDIVGRHVRLLHCGAAAVRNAAPPEDTPSHTRHGAAGRPITNTLVDLE